MNHSLPFSELNFTKERHKHDVLVRCGVIVPDIIQIYNLPTGFHWLLTLQMAQRVFSHFYKVSTLLYIKSPACVSLKCVRKVA